LVVAISEPAVQACLALHWDLPDAKVEAHHGGMGSATWLVTHGGRRWVAKAVAPAQRAQFAGGLSVAALLDAAGIPAGAPCPARDGRPLVEVGTTPLALLTWVEGDPLTGAGVGDQRVIGETLALAHQALRDASVAGAQRFHWVRTDAPHLELRPWIRPAVTAAVAALEQLGPASLTWGLLHADPAPEHFRLDASSGRCGLIDWSVALEGPLVYDLASAVMYVGGPDHGGHLVEAYLGRAVVPADEVEHALPVMLRFRWAVQADYFAWRIVNHDLTGIAGPADNEKGLEDARRQLG
jgi:Ser/Thr protein kinase RdoA (MazF antagonist)